METLKISSTVKPVRVTNMTVVHDVVGMNLLEGGYYMVMQHGRRWHHCFKKIRGQDDVERVVASPKMVDAFRVKRKKAHSFTSDNATKQNSKISSAIIRYKELFTDKM